MGPRYNEGPKDWQNVYVTTKFLYIRVFFSFSITGVKKIVPYSENLVPERFIISRFLCA